MSGFLFQCIVGCIFYSAGLIIPRKSPCIMFGFMYFVSDLNGEKIKEGIYEAEMQLTLL
jgi:hypothetical protein